MKMIRIFSRDVKKFLKNRWISLGSFDIISPSNNSFFKTISQHQEKKI